LAAKGRLKILYDHALSEYGGAPDPNSHIDPEKHPDPIPEGGSFQTPKADPSNLAARDSIAIVDDDEDVCNAYLAIVKRLGYNSVFLAHSGDELLKSVAEGETNPGVVLMDYRMPGSNGIIVGMRLRAFNPAVRVIITTADDSVRHQAISAGFLFLQKPFSMSELGDLLASR
jgi:CheY-like chemotaxis protein